jgi:hypothetical protein
MGRIRGDRQVKFRVNGRVGEKIFWVVFAGLRRLAGLSGALFELFGHSSPPGFYWGLAQPSLGLELHVAGEEYLDFMLLCGMANARGLSCH